VLLESAPQWLLGLVAAFLFGFSKTGIAGIGIVGVALMAMAAPAGEARQSVGLVLPVLIFCDLFAVAYYRRHAQWRHLAALMPAALVGIGIGWWLMDLLGDAGMKETVDDAMRYVIGGIVIVLVGFSVVTKRYEAFSNWLQQHRMAAAGVGVAAGITTMLANAAGPIMAVYLLAMGLPKFRFIGTAAWYFLILNWVKVPLMAEQGIITADSLKTDLFLFPGALVGVCFGIFVLKRITQKSFEGSVATFAALAGLMLIFKPQVIEFFQRLMG
jgi:hypothetical protein